MPVVSYLTINIIRNIFDIF